METKVTTPRGGYVVSKDKMYEFINLGIDLSYDGKVFKTYEVDEEGNKFSKIEGDFSFENREIIGVINDGKENISIVELIRIPLDESVASELKEKYKLDESKKLFVDVLKSYPNVLQPLGYGFADENNEPRYVEDLRGKKLEEIVIEKGNFSMKDLKKAIKEFLEDEDFQNDYPDIVESLKKYAKANTFTEEEVKEIRNIIESNEDAKKDKAIQKLFKLKSEWNLDKNLSEEMVKSAPDKFVLNGILTGINRKGETYIVYTPNRVEFKVSKSQFAKTINNDQKYGERFKALQIVAGKSAWDMVRRAEKDPEYLTIIEKKTKEYPDLQELVDAVKNKDIEKLKEIMTKLQEERYNIIREKAKDENLIEVSKLLVKGTDGNLFIKNPLHSEGIPLLSKEEFNKITALSMVSFPRVVKDATTGKFAVQYSFYPTAIKTKDGNFYGAKPTVPYTVYKTLSNIINAIEKGELKKARALVGDGFENLKGIDELKKTLSKRETQYVEWLNDIQKRLKDAGILNTKESDEKVIESVKKVIESSKDIQDFKKGMEDFFKSYLENGGYFEVSKFKQGFEKLTGKEINDLKDTKGMWSKEFYETNKDKIKEEIGIENYKDYIKELKKLASTFKVTVDLTSMEKMTEKLVDTFNKLREEKIYKYENSKLYGVNNALYYYYNLKENISLAKEGHPTLFLALPKTDEIEKEIKKGAKEEQPVMGNEPEIEDISDLPKETEVDLSDEIRDELDDVEDIKEEAKRSYRRNRDNDLSVDL